MHCLQDVVISCCEIGRQRIGINLVIMIVIFTLVFVRSDIITELYCGRQVIGKFYLP